MREDGLMERALGSIGQDGDNIYKEKIYVADNKDLTEFNIDKNVNKEVGDKVSSCKKLVDTIDEVYSFNSPLKLPFIGQKVDLCGVCGNRAGVVVPGAKLYFIA